MEKTPMNCNFLKEINRVLLGIDSKILRFIISSNQNPRHEMFPLPYTLFHCQKSLG